MTNFIRTSLLLATLVATPAFAEPAPASERVIVRTADLDLGTASGQRLLDRRLALAVVDACGAASRSDLAGSNAVRLCRYETRARLSTDRQRLIGLTSRLKSIATAAR